MRCVLHVAILDVPEGQGKGPEGEGGGRGEGRLAGIDWGGEARPFIAFGVKIMFEH